MAKFLPVASPHGWCQKRVMGTAQCNGLGVGVPETCTPCPAKGTCYPREPRAEQVWRESRQADLQSQGPGSRKGYQAGSRAAPHPESRTHLLRLLGQVEPISPAELDQPLQVPPCLGPQ